MKGKALLFGLNYAHCKEGKLNGCINDVYGVANYIQKVLDMPTVIYTDDIDLNNTSYDGIIKNLYNLAVDSYRDNLEFVWIHYSGHGSYQKDTSGDEADGMDEGLVPSDYEKKGILLDDIINHVLSIFNPRTKILFVCDSCHSGTILDLKYSWNSRRQSVIENNRCNIKAKTILISGCMDNQTSADAYNLLGDYKHIGALTASLLKVLQKNPNYIYDVFYCIDAVRSELRRGNFSQYPCLSTNFDVVNNPSMILDMRGNNKEIKELPITNMSMPPPALYPQNNMTLQVPVQQPIYRTVQYPNNNQQSLQQIPVQQIPVQQIPVQQIPVQQIPVQQIPVQQIPVQQIPVQQIPVQQIPVQIIQVPVQQQQQNQYQQQIQYVPIESCAPNNVQFRIEEHPSIYDNIETISNRNQDVYYPVVV